LLPKSSYLSGLIEGPDNLRLRLEPSAATKQINTMCVRLIGGREGLRLQSEIASFRNADAQTGPLSVAAAHVMLLALLPRGAPPWWRCHHSINPSFSFAI
jgi:hypothetical protein